ncbi:putative methyltransferase [Anoxybacillus thermarum]|uniref:Putative methyltransferase n=1 Tax=Anoxybacillus thermarum TaxID=404937 RepID=A0A0D0RUV1_9BACL|nr:site-specific DNA-methyltransferase [Anoxybacillus thermarum]KIQ95372.1 putative methyltransferase [Anoxybacillus thermarum]
MSEKLSLKSKDLLEERIKYIKQLFPEVVTEGKINFEKLRLILGEEVNGTKERYELNWVGKNEAIKTIQVQSSGTLIPVIDESINFDKTENIIIEGDNLEVLKILQRSYYGKIKMIYIDPPYNTGNDFIYPDNFKEGLNDYLKYSGQINEQGFQLSSNTETTGRLHSKWLNMMYPRLFLARNLLRDDGVIFVSIDDHEVKNLRYLLDEIFGEENFVAEIVWEKVHTRKNSAKYFSDSHEYILCYAKRKITKENEEGWVRNLLPRENTDAYSNPDNDPNGPWKPDPIYANNPYDADYEIVKPNGVVLKRPPGKYWRYSEKTIKEAIENNRIIWGEGDSYPMIKRYLKDVQDGLVPVTLFTREFAGDNALGNDELKNLLGAEKLFPYPKPSKLIQRLIQIGTNEDDIILDFFAGTGVTGDAILNMNKDGGNRKFILIQLPEPTKEGSAAREAGYKTISEICKARISKVIQKIEESGKSFEGIGFKFFKLTSSNFKIWDGEKASQNPDELAEQLRLFVNNIQEGRTKTDILYEIMLKSGFMLTDKVEKIDQNKELYSIKDGDLIVCLEDFIDKDLITKIIELHPKQFICLDSAFHNQDQLKTNTVLEFKEAGIVFKTV